MKIVEKLFEPQIFDRLSIAIEIISSIALGIAVTAAILFVSGFNPWRCLSIVLNPTTLVTQLDYVLSEAAPLVFTSIAFAIPLAAGLFNIGGEGQFYLGAVTALAVGIATRNPVLPLLCAAIGGALLGLAIGAMRMYLGINEVVSSIMMNWVAYYVALHLVNMVYKHPTYPDVTLEIPPSARVGYAFLWAIVFSIAAYIVMHRTRLGYAIRVCGYSERSAIYAGIDPKKIGTVSMAIGGAFASLGGALHVMATLYCIDVLLSGISGYGFNGIGVTLIARCNYFAIPIVSILISVLTINGQWLELETGAPPHLAQIIVGAMIVALSIPYAYRLLLSYARSRYLARGAQR